MMRLARARILANVALAAEEQEQQRMNQEAWENRNQEVKSPAPEPEPVKEIPVKLEKPVEPPRVVEDPTEIVAENKVGKFVEINTDAVIKRKSKFMEKPLFTMKTADKPTRFNALLSKSSKPAKP